MKIHSIYIDGYKNINNIGINMPEDSQVAGLIGNNGSGKSNILEALTRIFASVYNNEDVDFSYKILYSIGDNNFEISNIEKSTFLKNGKKVNKADRIYCLPRNIFLYYCGETDRLKNMALNCVDKDFEKSLKNNEDIKIKYLSAVGLKEFPAALLANAVYCNKTFENVCDLMGIEGIEDTVELVLKRPGWSKSAPITEDSFWNAQGTVASTLHALKDIGEMTINDRNSAIIKIDDFRKIKMDSENPFDLFVRLELLMQADILSEINFDVIKNGKLIPLDYLSEGEKQLAQLLCLLEATKEHRALFLLDEFDSFLHPSWQRKFAEIISEIDISGQVLFTTHSPLTLGKMEKENIRIIQDGEVLIPSFDTYNRDITEVLEELMDVKKRPEEVDLAIKKFRTAAMQKNKDEAIKYREELKDILSEDDPFWTTVAHLMGRLER